MGRFETAWLTHDANLKELSDLAGSWINQVHARKPPKMIILDLDSSESPTHGRHMAGFCSAVDSADVERA